MASDGVRVLGRRFFETIRVNGGIRACAWKMLRGEDLRIGTLIGEDKYGNRYYENNRYFMVASNQHTMPAMQLLLMLAIGGWNTEKDKYWNFDASLVPPDWHRWLHCMTDDPPSIVPLTERRFIWKEHKENLSGTNQQYVPSTTTMKKIEEWVPPVNQSK